MLVVVTGDDVGVLCPGVDFGASGLLGARLGLLDGDGKPCGAPIGNPRCGGILGAGSLGDVGA